MLNWGVVGSVYGTLLAQALSLCTVFLFRRYSKTALKVAIVRFTTNRKLWLDFLALGAPTSLSYVGVALSSAFILYNLQIWSK